MSWHYSAAWFAGFFDGEGCVSIIRRRRTKNFIEYAVSVQIAQADRSPIDLLHDRFGGCLSVASRGIRKFYYLRWHGKQAESVLEELRPFVLVKRHEVDLALDLRALIGQPGHRVGDNVVRAKQQVWERFREYRRGLALPQGV